MATETSNRQFLKTECLDLFKSLNPDEQARFGIMTPQHMVEHLILTTKSMVKRHGEPDPALAEKQAKWQGFLANPVFKHFPKDDAKLSDLRYDSLEAAIAGIPEAVNRLYETFEANPDYKGYNPMMGEYDFETVERFTVAHFKYHMNQFGLVEV